MMTTPQQVLEFAAHLGMDKAEVKVEKATGAVVRLSFWQAAHASIEAALSPDDYDIIVLTHTPPVVEIEASRFNPR